MLLLLLFEVLQTQMDDHVALHGTLLLPEVTAHNICSHIGIQLGAVCLQEQGTLALAEGLCMRLLDYGASSKERAKALLREIRALQVCLLHSLQDWLVKAAPR
jgi:hypothetical protein